MHGVIVLSVYYDPIPCLTIKRLLAILMAGMVLMAPAGCRKNGTLRTSPLSLGLERVATGLDFPVYLTTPPGNNNRLFIVEKGGAIRIIKNGTLLDTPFLDISNLVSTGGEQGLLGLAFDPNYARNGRFYVSYTDTSGDSRITRYLVSGNPDVAQNSPDRILLTIDQPFSNHNGGNIIFGPDGYLYIGMGDGGSGDDPQGNGQDLTDLLGSILRIDVRPLGKYTVPGDNPYFNRPSQSYGTMDCEIHGGLALTARWVISISPMWDKMPARKSMWPRPHRVAARG